MVLETRGYVRYLEHRDLNEFCTQSYGWTRSEMGNHATPIEEPEAGMTGSPTSLMTKPQHDDLRSEHSAD